MQQTKVRLAMVYVLCVGALLGEESKAPKPKSKPPVLEDKVRLQLLEKLTKAQEAALELANLTVQELRIGIQMSAARERLSKLRDDLVDSTDKESKKLAAKHPGCQIYAGDITVGCDDGTKKGKEK